MVPFNTAVLWDGVCALVPAWCPGSGHPECEEHVNSCGWREETGLPRCWVQRATGTPGRWRALKDGTEFAHQSRQDPVLGGSRVMGQGC